MHLSLSWLNSYLSPGDLSPQAAEELLTNLGFPIESWDGDRFDLEVTSNRGDLLCHLGAAREIAAKTGRTLKTPDAAVAEQFSAGSTIDSIKLVNSTPRACPMFYVRAIRGVTVGPSPAWLRERLESIGQRSINNIVDVTNFINYELGNPCHAFDLSRLEGRILNVRWAKSGELLTTLDGKRRTLADNELVVADAVRAQSLAGVMGGLDSEVSASTTDIALEMATWAPGVVRRAARRHNIRTDASHRFERTVDPRTLPFAIDRAAKLINEVAGGKVCQAALSSGPGTNALIRVRFRPTRAAALLGIPLPTDSSVRALQAVGVQVNPNGRAGDDLVCTIPAHRPDLTREVDLIEEVARITGLDAIPINEKMLVDVKPPQPSELARRELSSILSGRGFYEAVTFSFCTPKEAELFLPTGLQPVMVDDDRRGGEPMLRPSVLTGLLTSRRKNQHAQVHVQGGVRLFEIASVFAQSADNKTVEHTNLALLLDAVIKGKTATTAELQHAVRNLRGVIESLASSLAGPSARLEFNPDAPYAPAFDPAAYAKVSLAGAPLGYIGLLTPQARAMYDLATPCIAAELNLQQLISAYPPKATVTTLPEFPGIERDISVIVDETISWRQIQGVVHAARKAPLEHVAFVGSFRGQQIGKGRKSVTLRLSFRDPARTLRHEEIDPPVAGIVSALQSGVGAQLRA